MSKYAPISTSNSRKGAAAWMLLALGLLAALRSWWLGDASLASSRVSHKDNSTTLVILMGNVRGGEPAWQSLYRNVLNERINGPRVDLALAVGRPPNATSSSSLYERAKYVWEFDEWNDWTDALDQITRGDTRWHDSLFHAAPKSGILGACGDLPGSGAVVFWLRWFLAQQLVRLQLVQHYDRFVVTRTDHYYLCPLVFSDFAIDEVWVPEGQDFQGINDRHVMAPAHKILDVLNILPPILRGESRIQLADPGENKRYPQDYPHPYTAINAESLIQLRWQEMNITPRRFRRSMFTCAVPGDPTRWTRADESLRVLDGVMLKYPHEYDAAQCTCFHTKKHCDNCPTCDGR